MLGHRVSVAPLNEESAFVVSDLERDAAGLGGDDRNSLDNG